MIRSCAALSLLALAACAAPPPAPDPRAVEAEQVYQALRLQQVEHQMRTDDDRLTYGFAAVSCGLRSPQWLDMLQYVYAHDYQQDLQQNPLTPEQLVEARAYAAAHISNPSPPPYICGRLATDSTLADLDYSIGLESLILASEKKKQS